MLNYIELSCICIQCIKCIQWEHMKRMILPNEFICKVRALEKAKITENYASETCEATVKAEPVAMGTYNDTESESSDSEPGRTIRQPKKLKVTGLHH